MIEIDQEQTNLRQHLLGRLDESAREQLEERLVTDPQFREVALIVEGELVDDYLAGLLPAADRKDFDNYYLDLPNRRQEFEITTALRNHAIKAEVIVPEPNVRRPLTSRLMTIVRALFAKPSVPALAGFGLLLILLAGLYLTARFWWPDRHEALVAEINMLNRQPIGKQSPLTVALSETLNRAPGQVTKIIIPGDVSIVELQALVAPQTYQGYQASLRVVDTREDFTISELRSEPTTTGQMIRVKLPARLLTPRDYVLTLRGLTADGRLETINDYFFRVAP